MIFTEFCFLASEKLRCYSKTVLGSFSLVVFLLVSKIHLVFHCHIVPTVDTCVLFSLCAQGIGGILSCSNLQFRSVMDGREGVRYRL